MTSAAANQKRDARQMADALDRYAGLDVPPPYWLSGVDALASFLYCRSCVEKVAAEYAHAGVDGGYGGESDSCRHCENCGRLLDYTLTDDGAGEEIAHFRTVTFTKPLSFDEAYHVARLLEAAEDDPEAIAIGERAIAAAQGEGS